MAGILAALSIRVRDRGAVRGRLAPPVVRRVKGLSRVWRPAARLVVAATGGWWLAGVIGLAAGLTAVVALPRIAARRQAARRRDAIDEELADAVASIAAGLRAGMSVLTSIGRAADDVGEPLATGLRDVVVRASLGLPLRDSLGRFSSDVGTPGARLVAIALTLHHRVGGESPTVLDRLAETLRHRADGEREIRSLTAQARLSGTILGVLPVAFFLLLGVTSRDDITSAYRSPAGATAIVAGLCMQGTAFLWIRRLLRVDA